MRWMVIFSVQALVDFSFVWRDSWVAASGMVTSSGLITCEKDNIGGPWLKHCNWACWRASVCTFPTCCISILSVLQTTALPGTCASLQPCCCGGVRNADACYNCCVGIPGLYCLFWASRSNRLWADQYTPPALWQSRGWLGGAALIMVCPNLCCSILNHKVVGWHWSTLTFCSRLTVSKDVRLV